MRNGKFRVDFKQQNPWWETGDVSTSDHYTDERRSDYHHKFRKVISSDFVAIAGAAGTGKTTILHQLAYDLSVEEDVPVQNIMYLPLGDPRFQIGSNLIRDAIDEFATYYWRRDASSPESYVLIDDAHASNTWDQQVLNCLETYDNLTVTITLPTLAKAALPAETADIIQQTDLLLPPKYYDIVTELYDINIEKEDVKNTRAVLQTAADNHNSSQFEESLRKLIERLEDTNRLKRGVLEFLRGDTRDTPTEELRRNLELTVYRDVPRYQQFDDRSDLHALCAIAAMNPGQTLGLKDLSEILDCDRRTLQRYIDLLEEFFILTPSYQYKHERRRSVKLYIRDPLILSAILDIDLSGLLNSATENRLMTTVIFDHLKRLTFGYHQQNVPVQFWERGGNEIDYIIETPEGTPIPVATPINSDRHPEDRINNFCDQHDCGFGLHITRDIQPDVTDTVVSIPLWLFLFFI